MHTSPVAHQTSSLGTLISVFPCHCLHFQETGNSAKTPMIPAWPYSLTLPSHTGPNEPERNLALVELINRIPSYVISNHHYTRRLALVWNPGGSVIAVISVGILPGSQLMEPCNSMRGATAITSPGFLICEGPDALYHKVARAQF